MIGGAPREFFLHRLFAQLRSRGLALGVDDYEALWLSLRAGFGWTSPEALRDLCCALWAKSRQEQAMVRALFAELGVERWEVPEPAVRELPPAGAPPETPETQPPTVTPEPAPAPPIVQEAPKQGAGLPPISLGHVPLPSRPLLLSPRYPITERDVAQACRRLRRRVREGPAVELDVEATIGARCRRGVAGPVVLAPRPRNTARLLVLVDRGGSMAPFHPFVAEVCTAIATFAGLPLVSVFYFHNSPVKDADDRALDELDDDIAPRLDPVLPLIHPSAEGAVFLDPGLRTARPLSAVLGRSPSSLVLVISDAGAARGGYQISRLLDTVAFLKHLRALGIRYAWLNPLPADRWSRSTAGQLARHAPMFPLDRSGLRRAVEVLQGRHVHVERPIRAPPTAWQR